MERQELYGRVDVVGSFDAFDAELAEPFRGDERVVRNDAHPETGCAARDLLTDASEAEHTEGLVGELDPAVGLALPASLLQRRMGLRDVPCERDEQADSVLGGRDHCRLRCVR